MLPFALSALASRAAVPHLADTIASSLTTLLADAPHARIAVDLHVSGPTPLPTPVRFVSEASPGGAIETKRTPDGKRTRDGVFVSAAVVARALERRDVGATGSERGPRLHGVSRYGTGLRDGDVVLAVGGTPTPSINAMVAAAMGAASGGASRISGQIVRDGDVIDVVLELPK